MVEFLKEVPSIRFMALRRYWYAISALVLAIVKSTPFQMRRAAS